MTGLARFFIIGGVFVVGAMIAAGVIRRNPSHSAPGPVRAPETAVTTVHRAIAASPGVALLPPTNGTATLRVLAPTLLEISWASPGDAKNSLNQELLMPPANVFSIRSGATPIAVTTVGMRRRVAYAPFKQRDLRIGTSLFLKLGSALTDGQRVEVNLSGKALWSGQTPLSAEVDPQRLNPLIHVNQSGYILNASKTAMVGYFLGTLGEADIAGLLGASSANPDFSLIDAAGGEVFRGKLLRRPDQGFPYPAYQAVWEANFSQVTARGTYRVFVPGLGTSEPFQIDDAAAGALARTYALGIYHQRCGTDNSLPFTRFTHGPCHTTPASVPDATPAHENCNWTLETENAHCKENARHTAKGLTNVTESLYPFVNRGPVDVRGGHHDAGDYSKYTINSASFVHQLVIACDALPGVAALDNLGIPESGDGKGDVLQEAKWEADFLAKMQDTDGGFYFLVYPRERRYEDNVTPDRGDPQVVFPKNTAATAAAVAALAQCASSPHFKQQFPEVVPVYLEKARKGWAFLMASLATQGKDGAYQRITHYGDDFLHDDELAWAAVEMFLATGEDHYAEMVAEWFKPNDPELRKWGWVRLFDSQGNAVRSYALAVKAGRISAGKLNPALYEAAQQELRLAGEDHARRSEQSAYGTSFPEETKRVRSAGWYFSLDAAFDLALASQTDGLNTRTTEDFRRSAIENIGYEQGRNPLNITYLTGLGNRRQFEIVHQFAQNDRRMLPPTGIPLGNIQDGISWIDLYKNEPAKFSLPSDEDPQAPYPFYDRWADAFNLSQEFVILNQARGLAVAAWLMAQTPLRDQQWKPVTGKIQSNPGRISLNQPPVTLRLVAPGLDLSSATIVWEAEGMHPAIVQQLEWRPSKIGPTWVEAEAQLPDGRRVFGVLETTVGK